MNLMGKLVVVINLSPDEDSPEPSSPDVASPELSLLEVCLSCEKV